MKLDESHIYFKNQFKLFWLMEIHTLQQVVV